MDSNNPLVSRSVVTPYICAMCKKFKLGGKKVYMAQGRRACNICAGKSLRRLLRIIDATGKKRSR